MKGNDQMKRRNRTQQGMTLFEMVVVVFVLSIVSILMFQVLVVNVRENGRFLSRVERARELHAASQRLARDIESAVPYRQGGKTMFRLENRKEGQADSDRVVFVLPVRRGDGTIGMVERAYHLEREIYGAKPVLLLAYSDDAEFDGEIQAGGGHVVTVMLHDRQSVSFNVEVAGPGDRTWKEEWEDAELLPEKVRIHLKATDPRDPEHPVEIVETVYLMAG
jgi:prepilin-type N-terminal cleavage/methylation domain-containing protein